MKWLKFFFKVNITSQLIIVNCWNSRPLLNDPLLPNLITERGEILRFTVILKIGAELYV